MGLQGRITLLIVATVGLVFGPAIARDRANDGLIHPTAAAIVAAFPQSAGTAPASGSATVQCRTKGAGPLVGCQVLSGWSKERGLDVVALKLVSLFRFAGPDAPRNDSDGYAGNTRTVMISLRFYDTKPLAAGGFKVDAVVFGAEAAPPGATLIRPTRDAVLPVLDNALPADVDWDEVQVNCVVGKAGALTACKGSTFRHCAPTSANQAGEAFAALYRFAGGRPGSEIQLTVVFSRDKGEPTTGGLLRFGLAALPPPPCIGAVTAIPAH